MWADYGVRPGDRVKYQVIPVVGPAASLQLMSDGASEWTDELVISSDFSPHVSAYFNKGVVAAQWVSRALDAESPGGDRQPALKAAIAKVGDPLRDALGALLKPAVVKTIADGGDGSLYAALYELNDRELMDALEHLGDKANVILANGAFDPQKEPDENKAARDELEKTAVHVSDRMVSSGHFAHNKFAVGVRCRG